MLILADVKEQVVPLLTRILTLLEANMPEINDRLAQVQAELQAEATRVNNDLAQRDTQIETLKGQLATLQDQIDKSTLSPEARATFDSIDATINGIAPVPPVNVPVVDPNATPATPANPPGQ